MFINVYCACDVRGTRNREPRNSSDLRSVLKILSSGFRLASVLMFDVQTVVPFSGIVIWDPPGLWSGEATWIAAWDFLF